MNLQEIESKYKELIDKALRYTEELNDPVHGVGHVKGVVKNTWLLLEKNLLADKEVCILSAYWHDVGRKYGKAGHSLKSAEILKEELLKLNYDELFIEKCYKAIYKHDEKELPDTIEGIIIRDADKLDDLGIERWKECIEKQVRLPRIIMNLCDNLLLLEYSKELYNQIAEEWLEYLKNITIGK